MTVVFVSVFQEEAIVVKSLLESAGLKAALLAEGMLDVTPLFGREISGVRIAVPEEEAEDAQAVVADYLASKESPRG